MDFSFPIGTLIEIKIQGSPYTYYGRVLTQPPSRASLCFDMYGDLAMTKWIDRPNVQRRDKKYYKFRRLDAIDFWKLEESFRKTNDKIETS